MKKTIKMEFLRGIGLIQFAQGSKPRQHAA